MYFAKFADFAGIQDTQSSVPPAILLPRRRENPFCSVVSLLKGNGKYILACEDILLTFLHNGWDSSHLTSAQFKSLLSVVTHPK